MVFRTPHVVLNIAASISLSCRTDGDAVWDVGSWGTRNHALDGGPDPSREGVIWGHTWATLAHDFCTQRYLQEAARGDAASRYHYCNNLLITIKT